MSERAVYLVDKMTYLFESESATVEDMTDACARFLFIIAHTTDSDISVTSETGDKATIEVLKQEQE